MGNLNPGHHRDHVEDTDQKDPLLLKKAQVHGILFSMERG